jgi:hypothetical protein
VNVTDEKVAFIHSVNILIFAASLCPCV